MQRVIQRSKVAHRLAQRKVEKRKKLQELGELWEINANLKRDVKKKGAAFRQDKIDRKIDWETGSLAPRRDVGEKGKSYGTIQIYDVLPPSLRHKDRREWLHIQQGDRVVILTGFDKGKIGSVQDISLERGALQLKNLNMVDVHVPEWLRSENNDDREIVAISKWLPFKDVRLVYPLPDPDTGVYRDVIIDNLELKNRYKDKETGELTGDRIIAGTNIIIPWPEKSEEEHEDNDIDTLRISVDEETFRPFLLRPPMPLSVIDELRNKYSKFRTRHDYDYVQKKELEDRKVEGRRDLIKTMRTPLQELAELRARQKELQKKELSQDQLAKIGEVIARERAKATGAVKALEQ